MAEMLVQSENLVAIADKIRVLSGIEDGMSLGDMETRIGEANASIDAALSAIADRGVQIPEGANVGSIVGLIGDIGVDLPELATPATSEELFANKELIDGEGNVVTGTFSIDSELTAQDDLIAQIQAALEGKAAGGSGGNGSGGTLETITVSYSGTPDLDMTIYYIDGTMTLQQKSVSKGTQYAVLKGTIFIVTDCQGDTFGGCSKIVGDSSMCKGFLAIK